MRKKLLVTLMPYRSGWLRDFEHEKKRIEKVLGKKFSALEHVGSTAIPGMPAKPVIDIAIGIDSMKKSRAYIAKFKKLGYKWLEDFGGPSKHLLFARGPDSGRTHHVHLLTFNGNIWKNLIGFRDYMRTHKADAARYATLKRKLAKIHKTERGKYTLAKGPFVYKIFAKIPKK